MLKNRKTDTTKLNILGKRVIILIQAVGTPAPLTLRKSKAIVGLFSVIKQVLVTVKMHVLPSTRYLLAKTSGYQKRSGRRLSVQGKTELRQKNKRRC